MRSFVLSLIIAGVATAVAAQAPRQVLPGPHRGSAAGEIHDGQGRAIGAVMLMETPDGVMLSVEAHGLEPGWHGMHFHEKGDCSDTAFKNAGGHINHATKRPHGLLAPGGPDFGDLPNLWIGKDGAGRAQAFSALVSLHGAGKRPALLDADGSALVIHANPDDQSSQPIGGAGARVGCAVLVQTGLVPAG